MESTWKGHQEAEFEVHSGGLSQIFSESLDKSPRQPVLPWQWGVRVQAHCYFPGLCWGKCSQAFVLHSVCAEGQQIQTEAEKTQTFDSQGFDCRSQQHHCSPSPSKISIDVSGCSGCERPADSETVQQLLVDILSMAWCDLNPACPLQLWPEPLSTFWKGQNETFRRNWPAGLLQIRFL